DSASERSVCLKPETQDLRQRPELVFCHASEADLLAVVTNGGDNLQRQGKCLAAVFQGNDWNGTISDGVQKRFYLPMQRLFGGHRRLGHTDLRIDCWHGWSLAIGADREDENFLPPVVEGDILLRLEEAQLSHALGRYAAGGEIGDAAGVEFEPNVGDV